MPGDMGSEDLIASMSTQLHSRGWNSDQDSFAGMLATSVFNLLSWKTIYSLALHPNLLPF